MKGMIDPGGYLRIWRYGENRNTRASRRSCPFALQSLKSCGDWCPLFGDPEYTQDGKTALALCSRTLVFEEFEYRKKPKG